MAADPQPSPQRQRTLWCVFSDDLEALIPIDCTAGVDSVGHVKEKIKAKCDGLQVAAFRLNLFLPRTTIKDGFADDQHRKLHPRDLIYLDLPRSADPAIDLVCVRPRVSDRLSRDRGKSAPPWCIWTVADEV